MDKSALEKNKAGTGEGGNAGLNMEVQSDMNQQDGLRKYLRQGPRWTGYGYLQDSIPGRRNSKYKGLNMHQIEHSSKHAVCLVLSV